MPCKLTVAVSLKDTDCSNDWQIWVYPASGLVAKPAGIDVVNCWSDAKKLLAKGKRVLLFPEKLAREDAREFLTRVLESDLVSATGAKNDEHPLRSSTSGVAEFPTEFYTNWQWYDLLQDSQSLILDDTPADFRPIVQVIDNFARNHKLGNLFEARVGRGSLLVCAIDLPHMADKQPAARQLLTSLYAYVGSEDFRPTKELDATVLDRLLSNVSQKHATLK